MNKRYNEIGSKIREAREDIEMSQLELAEGVNFSSATAISLIESGQRKVSIDQLELIAEVLGKPISFFLGEEEPDITLDYALRSDSSYKNLSSKERKSIADFAEFVKSKKK